MTNYSYTDQFDNYCGIVSGSTLNKTAFISVMDGVYIDGEEAPATAHAILDAAGRTDVVLVEGIGPLPKVTKAFGGAHAAQRGDARMWTRPYTPTQFLRDRAACAVALLNERLAVEAEPAPPVLREDVREAVVWAAGTVDPGSPEAVSMAVEEVLRALVAVPGLAATEESL